MKTPWALTCALFLAFTLSALAACNASGSASLSGGTGRLEVHLTDAPIDLSGVASVAVTITDVLVYSGVEGMTEDATGPIVLINHPETFDLLTLTGGATALLASGEVPAGFYHRIRLEISEAALTYDDGSTADLKIESGKVDVPIGFQVRPGGESTVVLDFDAAASVQVNETATGTLILRPVVTPKRQ